MLRRLRSGPNASASCSGSTDIRCRWLLRCFSSRHLWHALCGTRAYHEEAAEHGQHALSVWQYCGTSQFWFESFQNWQSEFLAMFAIVVLLIWLREDGSPESKPVTAPHAQTGES
ncbi:MAG TPA: DUF6766 family protein [Terrimicrobiaceae bacterium]|nr:DUF6766 family protein [Terrimicrobiaceae bacterium]